MSNKIKIEFEIMDPKHSDDEVIAWITEILFAIGIKSPKVWVWASDKKKKPTKEEVERAKRVSQRLRRHLR